MAGNIEGLELAIDNCWPIECDAGAMLIQPFCSRHLPPKYPQRGHIQRHADGQ